MNTNNAMVDALEDTAEFSAYDAAVQGFVSSDEWDEAASHMYNLGSYFMRLTGPSGEVADMDIAALRKDLADLSAVLDRLEPKLTVLAAFNEEVRACAASGG